MFDVFFSSIHFMFRTLKWVIERDPSLTTRPYVNSMYLLHMAAKGNSCQCLIALLETVRPYADCHVYLH